MRERKVPAVQIIYSILEQDPAVRFFPIAQEEKTGLLSRVPHASGLLDGTYTKDTVFEATDHRSHRRQEWLTQGLKKLAALDFLTESMDATIGQIAIKFALAAPQLACVLPNITNQSQLEEFAAAPETEDIPEEFLDQLREALRGELLRGAGRLSSASLIQAGCSPVPEHRPEARREPRSDHSRPTPQTLDQTSRRQSLQLSLQAPHWGGSLQQSGPGPVCASSASSGRRGRSHPRSARSLVGAAGAGYRRKPGPIFRKASA